jgi:hypothetical protein
MRDPEHELSGMEILRVFDTGFLGTYEKNIQKFKSHGKN